MRSAKRNHKEKLKEYKNLIFLFVYSKLYLARIICFSLFLNCVILVLCLTAPVKPFQILTPHKHDDINMLLLCLLWF